MSRVFAILLVISMCIIIGSTASTDKNITDKYSSWLQMVLYLFAGFVFGILATLLIQGKF